MVAAPGARGGKEVVASGLLALRSSEIELEIRDLTMIHADHDRRGLIVDGFGARYVLDFQLTGPKGSATVRSAWIVRIGEDFPRFTSCYVL